MSVLKDNHASKQLFAHYQLTDSTTKSTANLGGTSVAYTNQTYYKEITLNGWGGDAGTVMYFPNGGYCNMPYKRYHITHSGDGGCYRKTDNDIILKPNTTYTMSVYVKASQPFSDSSYSFNINRGRDNYYINYGQTIYFTTEWQRLVKTFTTNASEGGAYGEMSIVYNDTINNYYVYYSGFQIEEKDSVTEWTSNNYTYCCLDASGHKNTIFSGKSEVNLFDDSAIYNKSVCFNGDMEQYLKRPAFTNIRNNLSISCWIKLLSGNKSNTPQYIISQGGHHTKVGVSIYSSADGGSLYCDIGTESSTALQIPFNGFVKNQWCHAVVVYDGNHVQTFLNGQPLNSIIDKLPKLNGNIVWGEYVHDFVLGRRAYINSSSPDEDTSFNGLLSDVRLYSTALSAQDVLSLYQVRKRISKEGDIYINLLDENTNYIKSSINKQGIQKASCLNEASEWIPIMYHNNLGGTNLFKTSNDFTHYVYNNENCWANFQLINQFTPVDGWYHFRAIQQLESGEYQTYEWKQKINPINATYNDVDVSGYNIQKIKNIPSYYGGLYRRGTALTYLNFNNGHNDNWWGAFGSTGVHNGGVPAIGAVVKGVQILYLKNTNMTKVQEYNHGVIYANSFNEII